MISRLSVDTKQSGPTLTDYVAGAILGNGVVWIWYMSLFYLSSLIPVTILADVSLFIYVFGGAASSYLVCRRASSGHLITGIKLAFVTWMFSFFLSLSFDFELTVSFFTTLLVCFVVGDVLGAYLALRSRLRRPKPKAVDPNGG